MAGNAKTKTKQKTERNPEEAATLTLGKIFEMLAHSTLSSFIKLKTHLFLQWIKIHPETIEIICRLWAISHINYTASEVFCFTLNGAIVSPFVSTVFEVGKGDGGKIADLVFQLFLSKFAAQ